MLISHKISNNTRYVFCVAVFLTTMLFSMSMHAQVNASKGIPSFTNYKVGDLNVAGQQVWNVNEDQFGYIYTGTSSGLQKFDGVNWELLTSPVQEYNTNVRATLLSSSGRFYYGSLGDFGYVTQDSTGTTILKSLISYIPEDGLFNDIWSIREVNQKIYFQSREAIYIYSPDAKNKENSIRIWKPDTEFMYAFSTNDTYYVHQMNLGLFKAINGKLTFIPESEFLGKDRVQVLLPYHKPGTFLVGAFAGGLYLFEDGSFKKFTTEIDHLLQDRSLYKALALPDSTYALSVLGNGFFIIDEEGMVKSQFNTQNSIPDQSVYSFHLDGLQNLWVGTNNGLSKIEIFSPLTRFDSNDYEVGNVLSIGSYNDNLYIGTSTNVLYIDQKDGDIKKVEGFINSQVFDVENDQNQILASGDGIYRIQGKNAELIEATKAFQTIEILISRKHPGYVFLSGSYGIHVFKRYPTQGGKYRYTSIGPIAKADRYVYSLVEDGNGEIWGGTQAGVLYRVILPKTASGNLDVPNAMVKAYSEEDGIRGLSGVAVNVNEKIYTSGIDGFYFFNKQNDIFERDTVFSFSDEVAAINLDVYGLGSNELGDVFLNFKGEKRLAKLQPDSTYVLQNYPINLITASFTTASYTEPNGIYWFGTDEGLLRLDPLKDYKIDYQVPLFFTSVNSQEQKLALPGYIGGNLPELKFKGNQLVFNYVSPFFINEELITYQTYLEGFDKNWSSWENKTFREFTNLPVGDYTFRVRAKNTFGTISDEITYAFVVLPPWYATWWAIVIYVIFFGLLVYALVKMQTSRMVAKEKEKTREKELIQAKEIENAYEELKATQVQLVQQEKLASLGQLTAGIAHEIKNPLNFVNNFSEISLELIEEVKEEVNHQKLKESKVILELLEDIKANLSKIHTHGTRADGIVKSMLQHSRGGSGKKEPTDLNALVKEYVNLSFHGMRAGKTPFNVEIDLKLDHGIDTVPLIGEDFSRVIVNLCNNAFDAMYTKLKTQKQEGSDYLPKLNVRTIKKDKIVGITVEDNGPGITEEIKDKILQPFFTTKKGTEGTGLGLSITNDILKAHGATLEIDSELNSFTRFTMNIPNE